MLEKEEQLNKNIFKSSEIFLNFATLFCYSYCIIYQEEINMFEREEESIVIKCPNCGVEYLPGEIYIPNNLVGQPKDIERTIDGKIDVYSGIPQNLTETFECDHCGKPLKVTASLSFSTEIDEEKDFDSDYSVPLYADRLTLDEN